MKKYLSMVEPPQQQRIEVDEDKLKFSLSKVFIWEHFGITKSSYLSFTADEKEVMLRRCYSELYQKFYETGKKFVFLHC